MREKLAGLVRSLFGRRRLERDMEEEMRFHVDMEAERLAARGVPAELARTEALRRFGGVEKAKDEVRDAALARVLETLRQDVRYALRAYRRNPGFALAAVATLALGIGANSAIFSVVHGVLLQALPYGGGERLVRLRADAPGTSAEDRAFSPLEMEDLRTQARTLDGVVEYHNMWFVLLGRPEPERVATGVVSANFFDVLGVQAEVGRTFLPGEDKHGAEAVLVLSHDYWMKSFGGDPKVVGRVFTMNDRPHTVVGVLPPIPGYPDENDVYMPVSACPFRSNERVEHNRGATFVLAFARLKRGVPLAAARTELTDLAHRWEREHPETYPSGSRLSLQPLSLSEEMTRAARPTFLILLGAVGLVLLLACANVANLILARLVRRERELSLRAALGAGRRRLAAQLLTETVLLSLAGGLLGLGLAVGAHRLLVFFAARLTPRASEIAISGPVLLFTFAVAVGTGVALGLVPVAARRGNLVAALQDGGDRGATRSGRLRLRNLLIVAQVAISFVLLVGAGLMLRTIWKLQRVDPGFHTERVLTARLDLNFSRYATSEKRREFHEALLSRLAQEPGLVAAALSGSFPLNDSGGPNQNQYRVLGKDEPDAKMRQADFQIVSPDFFSVIGTPILRGRAFAASDRADGPPVMIVNETLARHVFGGESPLGHRVSVPVGKETRELEIVGIAGDVRQYGLTSDPIDQVYLPLAQFPALSATCLVRTATDPLAVARQVRAAVHSVGPEQPVDRFRTLEQVRSGVLESPRLTAILLVLFAGVALAITATGIAGVIGFSVGQRLPEFGIRMALGAQRTEILGMVLKQGLSLVATGLALGLGGALVLVRVLASLLYGVRPTDAVTLGGVLLLLTAVASGACLIPARRATSADPIRALRSA
jgi:putative ABC transport system permease protein